MGKRENFKEGGSKMLVVFEGLDNCGKTTIVENLKIITINMEFQ